MLTPYDLIDLAFDCREAGNEDGYTQVLRELELTTQPGESRKLLIEAGLAWPGVTAVALA